MKEILSCIFFIVILTNSFGQNIDFDQVKVQSNSDLFRIQTVDNEQTIVLEGNKFDSTIDPFTGMEKGNSSDAKVILIGERQTDYQMIAEMKFIRNNLDDCSACGWLGFAIRAQDFDNFEAVWFMPGVDKNNVAYIPIAHGVGPYWSEGYIKSEKGTVKLSKNEWFQVRAVVKGNDICIYVNDQLVLAKKASYYLTSGFAGFFVGTATDAAFRKVKVEKIGN